MNVQKEYVNCRTKLFISKELTRTREERRNGNVQSLSTIYIESTRKAKAQKSLYFYLTPPPALNKHKIKIISHFLSKISKKTIAKSWPTHDSPQKLIFEQ